jgi:hypothetical protein
VFFVSEIRPKPNMEMKRISESGHPAASTIFSLLEAPLCGQLFLAITLLVVVTTKQRDSGGEPPAEVSGP